MVGELIEFLSHDLRSPQVSILSLIELQRQLTSRVDDEVFYSQIADKLHQTLDWAVDLVELSKVKVNQYQMNELNAAQILDEAIEHVWAQAQAKVSS